MFPQPGQAHADGRLAQLQILGGLRDAARLVQFIHDREEPEIDIRHVPPLHLGHFSMHAFYGLFACRKHSIFSRLRLSNGGLADLAAPQRLLTGRGLSPPGSPPVHAFTVVLVDDAHQLGECFCISPC